MLDFTNIPKSKTPIACLTTTGSLADLTTAMKLAHVSNYKVIFWRKCTEREKQLFPPGCRRNHVLFISPFTEKQLAEMENKVCVDPDINKQRELENTQALKDAGYTEDEIYERKEKDPDERY